MALIDSHIMSLENYENVLQYLLQAVILNINAPTLIKSRSHRRRNCWKLELNLSLTWAPTVQAGPASEKLTKGYAFYHNKAPEHSDPLSSVARLVRLVIKNCWRVDRK